ncbi:MAG: hypothetical protein NC355_05010 [Blautia sp.]|nr:hypothetical protein [Blautia sp.]
MAEKAAILVETEEGGAEEIEVQFNPESYNISYGAGYSEKKIPGLDGPISQFVAGESMTLEMTLYFDTYEPPTTEKPEGGSSVAERTKKLAGLAAIRGSLHRPPEVIFCWGSLQFCGYVAGVKESYTMFLSDGTPVRAKVDVTFKSLLNPGDSRRLEPFESPDRSKLRILKEKEQLWHHAWREYGDVELWRKIAVANGINNPLEIEAGDCLRLPPL